MKIKYDEIMEKVEVSGEMKTRILSRLSGIEPAQNPRPKIVNFSARRRYLTAACLAVLLLGSIALPQLWNSGQPAPDYVISVPHIAGAASAEELSEMVGFAVTDLPNLPFEIDQAIYTAYGDQLAEITYQGDGQTATFRKSMGREDNSGDYTIYSATVVLQLNGMTVTLKGGGETYTLAVWSDGEYAYSLNLTVGLTAEAWRELILSMTC